jgi:hypothetical protein
MRECDFSGETDTDMNKVTSMQLQQMAPQENNLLEVARQMLRRQKE